MGYGLGLRVEGLGFGAWGLGLTVVTSVLITISGLKVQLSLVDNCQVILSRDGGTRYLKESLKGYTYMYLCIYIYMYTLCGGDRRYLDT